MDGDEEKKDDAGAEGTGENVGAGEGSEKKDEGQEGGEKKEEEASSQPSNILMVEVYDAKGGLVKIFKPEHGEDFVEQAKKLAKENNYTIGYR